MAQSVATLVPVAALKPACDPAALNLTVLNRLSDTALQTSRKEKSERIPFTITYHPHNLAAKTWRHMWVEFVVGFRPCFDERFFSGY